MRTFPEEAIPAWLLASQEEPSAGRKRSSRRPTGSDETDLTAEMAEAGGIEELPDWLTREPGAGGRARCGASTTRKSNPAALTYDEITQGEETTLEKATAEPAHRIA